ncbi:LuxR C-terminal-related transcriptional regulator [Bacteroidota bacterium]
MRHLIIFFELTTLVIGALIIYYFVQFHKRSRHPLPRALYYYLIFTNLAVLNELFFKYFFLNVFGYKDQLLTMIWDWNMFVIWIGVVYSFSAVVFSIKAKEMSLWFRKIFIFAVSILVIGYIIGFTGYFYAGSTEFFVVFDLVSLYMILSFIIGLPVYTLTDTKHKKGSNHRNIIYSFVILFCAGYFLYLIFVVYHVHVYGNLIQSFLRLYFNIIVIFWFVVYYLRNNMIVASIKDNKEIITILGEKYKVSKREQEVLALLIDGKSNKEIENVLFISSSTVRNHISLIYKKIGINSRGQLMKLVLKFRDGN